MAVFLAIALSIDALGMGVSCGLRRLRLGFGAYAVLFFVSMGVMGLAVFFGNVLAGFLRPDVAEIIAAVWIMALGLWIALGALRKNQNEPAMPQKITKWASVQLALVLSLDSIGAGLAAAAMGISIYFLPILVATFQISFLALGVGLAAVLTKKFGSRRLWTLIAGMILMLIGIIGFLT